MAKSGARLDITADPPVLVDLKKCDLCGGCVGLCPPDCLEMTEHKLNVRGVDCIKCGFCIPACPVAALSWNEEDLTNGNGKNGN